MDDDPTEVVALKRSEWSTLFEWMNSHGYNLGPDGREPKTLEQNEAWNALTAPVAYAYDRIGAAAGRIQDEPDPGDHFAYPSASLVADAALAHEIFGDDELERHALDAENRHPQGYPAGNPVDDDRRQDGPGSW